MKDVNFDISMATPSTEFTNTATVHVFGYYSSAETKFKVCNYADLSVTKTTTKPIGYVYKNLIYIIKVLNKGPSKATGVILTDTLPSNSICSSIYLTQGTYKCSKGKITCYLGELNCNANTIAIIVVTPKIPCILTTHSVVTSNEYDYNHNNNFSTTHTRIYCKYQKPYSPNPFICIILLLVFISSSICI